MNSVQARKAIVNICKLIHEKGWVANHDGNVTVRIGFDRFLATPTAVSKRVITEDMLVVVDSGGNKISGALRPFSEINLHLAVYKKRDDVNAVVHAHPPYATAKACCGKEIIPFLPEAVVSIGDRIPLVPLRLPGDEAASILESFLEDYDALLLENHGVITYGVDLEQAYLRMELVEHLAKIEAEALRWGGVNPLPKEMIPKLLEVRAKAGLGKEGRKKSIPLFLKKEEDRSRETPALSPQDLLRKIAGVKRES